MVKEAGEAKAAEGGRKKKVVASISRAILFNKKDSLPFPLAKTAHSVADKCFLPSLNG